MSSIPHWSPSHAEVVSWKPSNGWMASFTTSDQIKCTALYLYFLRQKGMSREKAEQLALMILCKQKYRGLRYSLLQEKELEVAFSFSSSCSTSFARK